MSNSSLNILVLDAHPDKGRLTHHLLDFYCGHLPASAKINTIAIRDLKFDPVLHHGYSKFQPWEDDLQKVADAIQACDHLVIAFPMWWGSEPAPLKGLLDRILLPGFAFTYRSNSVMWDKLLSGRSADLIITMDTPPWYLRSVFGDPIGKKWRKQILGFCGFQPVRLFRCGMTRRGYAKKNMESWKEELKMAAQTVTQLGHGSKTMTKFTQNSFERQISDRKS